MLKFIQNNREITALLAVVLVFDGRLRCALERNLRRQKYARFMMPPPSVKPASSGKKREAA